ncbi:MAG: flavin-dependent oxidoreductase [Pseudolabrys sp.]|jgi:2-polyprenyl-6-methoxyphenol hydroxylase-like FAD-dependent oxidoreductase
MGIKVAIVGGGICGLSLALNLHRRGIAVQIHDRVSDVRPLGVGITLLPHAMREFTALGIGDELLGAGIENRESHFYNRFGQLIYREDRGKFAGYQYPEVGIHRGKLHLVLWGAVVRELGAEHMTLGHEAVGVEQDDTGATVHFKGGDSVRADIVVACDGIGSAIRKQFYPDDKVVFTGINTWRGVTRHKPILDGRTYMRVGSINTGKMVIYPIVDDIDGNGHQLINWMAEIKRDDDRQQNDWNRPGRLEDFFPIYENWRFDWLDVAQMIRDAEQILEYPMVDKDPIAQWTFGRVTLAGDAAHPMYPRGSNGGAQAAIDARTLADCLAKELGKESDPLVALKAYEAARAGPAAQVVRTNRAQPPDFINIKVEELVGDRPFENLDDYITQDELRALSDNYKRVAGFALADVGART